MKYLLGHLHLKVLQLKIVEKNDRVHAKQLGLITHYVLNVFFGHILPWKFFTYSGTHMFHIQLMLLANDLGFYLIQHLLFVHA